MVGETCLRPVLRLIALLLLSVSTAFCAPITLELTDGSIIKGDLVSWNGQQAFVKAKFGSLTFQREQLSQATLQRLDLLSGDPQKLAARLAELEATVESLRRDNAALRQQLPAVTGARTAPVPASAQPVRATLSKQLRAISKSLAEIAAQTKPDPFVDRFIPIAIAGIAAAIALGAAWFQRQHNFKSLSPLPDFHYNITFREKIGEKKQFSVFLRNNGPGPAIIKSYRLVTTDGRKKFASIEELKEHAHHEFSEKAKVTGTQLNADSVLKSTACQPLLDVDVSEDNALTAETFHNFRRSIDVVVEFEDIYRRLFAPIRLRSTNNKVRAVPLLSRVIAILQRKRQLTVMAATS